MQALLHQDDLYPYLLKNSVARLNQARDAASISGLGIKPLLPLGGKMYCMIPWLGSYAFLALKRFLQLKCAPQLGLKGFNSRRPYYIQFIMSVSEQDFYHILREEINKDIDPMTLLYPKEAPIFDKYDDILPEELTRKGFAMSILDVKEMKQKVLSWLENKEEK